MSMLTFSEAQRVLTSSVHPLEERETVPVTESLNRILAEDLINPMEHPDLAKSAVDGFALPELHAGHYRIAGEIAAGESSIPALSPGETFFVMTGAPVPDGSRTVIRVEDTEQENDHVVITGEVRENENINQVGSESPAGCLFARKGDSITKGLYPALVYAGIENIPVFRRPRVALLSSGNELLEPGEPYTPGMAYNVNRYIFQTMTDRLPLHLDVVATLPDDRKMTEKSFRELTEKYDLVITSGGISRGKFDYIRDVLSASPFDLILDRTAIRPGSPLMAAGLEKTLFMAMPGYPAAFLTNMVLYLLPLLRKSCGSTRYMPEVVKGVLATSMRSREGTDTFNRAEVELRDGEFCASDPGTQKTSHFLSFSRVGGLVYLDRGTGILPEGSEVDIYLLGNIL